MTYTAELAHDTVEAAPGDVSQVEVLIHNVGATAATFRLRTVGLAAHSADRAPLADVVVPLDAAVSAVVSVPVPVPFALGVGRHAVAIEVSSNRTGDRPSLIPFTVAIASVERVELTPAPVPIRGLRRAKFKLTVANYEIVPVDIALSAEAPGVGVKFKHDRLQLLPGQQYVTKAKVKGPRRWTGEPTQHNLLVTARGRAASTTTTAAFIQRPLFAQKLRTVLAAFVVIALWLGAIGGFAYWWSQRDDDVVADRINGVDTDGDGVADLFVVADGTEMRGVDTDGDGVVDLFIAADGTEVFGVDTDGDGIADSFTDADGNPVPDPLAAASGLGGGGGGIASGGAGGTGGADGNGGASGGAGGAGGDQVSPNVPTAAVVRGTVNAGGDVSDVSIVLTPIGLAEQQSATLTPGAGAIQGFIGGSTSSVSAGDVSKVWSARHGATTDGTLSPIRRTEAVEAREIRPEADGIWLFTDVALRQSYQVVFSKPGYDTQSFVVTPPDDGSATELDVELKPAIGSISGVVTDGSRPLGGVDLTITDGTLTFSTTSATVGEIGSWSIQGVSTPGAYTVTGVLRGFGTQVIQVGLGPGDQVGNANLSMSRGVGSISGRVVGSDGEPLGGVAVTASNGESVRTTSTLTEGDIGSYTIPQLAINSTFTLRVEREGYITQTRRLRVGGAIGNVSFVLSPTTLTMSGMIRSSQGGKGIPNAGLTLTTGDLTFKVVTAASPNPGSFEIADLPPGNYTVMVEHYQHVTATQFLAMEVGDGPQVLNVTLERTTGLPEIGTGSVVVEVIDPNAETTEQREIKNATIQLIRTQDGVPLPAITQEAFNFRVDDVPVGTYTLLVTAPRYNPAPARQVSVGLSEQRVIVEMLRLGQASGRVVDSISGEVLSDYFIDLYRQPETQGDAPVFTLASRADGSWQTPPDSLVPGTYRVSVSDAASPAGYRIQNDQLLDESVVADTPAGRLMMFTLANDLFDPVVVADIEADRLPTISGRVYRPQLDTVNATQFVPIDSPSLGVFIECADGVERRPATLLDVAGIVDAADPLYESYTISPETIDEFNLTGDCTLEFEADGGFESLTVDLPNVDASDGVSLSDRRVHTAMSHPGRAIGGSVYWLDGSTRRMLGGVDVSAEPITRFDSIESSQDQSLPRIVRQPISTTSDGSGIWDLDGQRYGRADYRFDATNFAPGVVTLLVDDTDVRSVGSTAVVVTETTGGRFDVQLSAPTPRDLTGVIEIKTVATPAFDELVISAVSPTGVDIVEASACGTTGPVIVRGPIAGDTMSFTICGASPGSWSVDVSRPDHHRYYGDAPPVSQLVSPGSTPQGGFDVSLFELAELELTLLDSAGEPLAVAPTVELVGVSTGPEVLSAPGAPPNVFVRPDIPVAAVDPEVNSTEYLVRIEVDGYDLSSAEVVDGPAPDASGAFPISVLAGETEQITLKLQSLGSISGSVEGLLGPWVTGPEAVDVEANGSVTALRVDVDGNAISGAPTVIPTVVDDTFQITGPPGYYLITVDHDNFQATSPPEDGIPDDVGNFDPPPDGPPTPVASTATGVFRLSNETDHQLQPWQLEIRRGSFDLSVFDSLDSAPAACDELAALPKCVDGAQFELWPDGIDRATLTPAEIPSGAVVNGHAFVDDLYPGTYVLEIRKFDDLDPALEVAFPAITKITVTRSTDSSVSLVTVRAPLPALAPTLTGKILAVNTDGDPVPFPMPLPDGATFSVVSDYDEEGIEIITGSSTTLVDNTESGDDTAEVTLTNAANGEVTYTFKNVPVGNHELSLGDGVVDALAAYDLDGAATRTVPVLGAGPAIGPNFVFTAPDVVVTADLGDQSQLLDGEITRATLTWTNGQHEHKYGIEPDPMNPGGTIGYGAGITLDPATNIISFVGVLPQATDYSLLVSSTLHDDLLVNVTIGPDLDGGSPATVALSASDTTMSGKWARLTGVVSQQDDSGTNSLGSGGRVELQHPSDVLATCPSLPNSECRVDGPLTDGRYEFDAVPGTYKLVVTQTGYQTETITPIDLGTQAGTSTTQDVTIQKLAQLKVTLSNGSAVTNPSIKIKLASGPLISPSSTAVEGGQPTATFVVESGDYTVVVVADDYRSTALPGVVSLDVGANSGVTKTLPRLLGVSVSGPTTIMVRVFSSPAGAQPLATKQVANNATALFTESDGLPTSGDVIVEVSGTNYRTKRIMVPFALDPSNVVVALGPNVTVTGVITNPAGVTLTGNKVAGSNVITATAGSSTMNGTVDSAGNYEFAGLGVDPDGTSRVWTIVYDKNGVGSSSGADTFTVTGTTPNPATGPSIKVTPKPVEVTFTVQTDASGSAVDLENASVTLAGYGPTLTNADGEAIFNIPESTSPLVWTVTADDHVTQTGTLPDFDKRDDVAKSVPLVSRARTLTVHDADGDPVENAAVTRCGPIAESVCENSISLGVTDADGELTFNTPLTAGTYTITATAPNGTVNTATLTVAAITLQGTLVPTTVALPPTTTTTTSTTTTSTTTPPTTTTSSTSTSTTSSTSTSSTTSSSSTSSSTSTSAP